MAQIDEIKKLSPEERIKRLKQLEEEKRKEIEEAEKLMKESLGELEHEEKIKQEIPIPQLKAVDIGGLFSKEEKQLFAAKRYEDSKVGQAEEEEKPKHKEKTLEDEVIDAPPELTRQEAEHQRQYGERLAQEAVNQLYTIAREAYNEFKETGQVDPGRLYALDVAAKAKDEATGGHYQAPTDEAQEQFGSVKSIIKYLRGR